MPQLSIIDGCESVKLSIDVWWDPIKDRSYVTWAVRNRSHQMVHSDATCVDTIGGDYADVENVLHDLFAAWVMADANAVRLAWNEWLHDVLKRRTTRSR